jgi:hypothetical protein
VTMAESTCAPIFIVGAARSGTKFLRGLLEGNASCRSVPYDVNYVWRYGNERHPDDVLGPELATPKVVRYIRRTLPHLAGMNGAPGQVMVEKTVGNALRVDFVRAVYPEGRIVHLVRDGRDVVESAMRMWTEPPASRYLLRKLRHFPLANFRYALWYAANVARGRIAGRRGVRVWGPRYPGIEQDVKQLSLAEVCATQWLESVQRAAGALAAMPGEQWMTVQYEKLTTDEAEVRRLCEFMGLADIEDVLTRYRRTVRTDRAGSWRNALTGRDLDRVMSIIQPGLTRCGYLGAE